jgi:hypothetical protein
VTPLEAAFRIVGGAALLFLAAFTLSDQDGRAARVIAVLLGTAAGLFLALGVAVFLTSA